MYVLTVDVGGTALTTPCEGGAGEVQVHTSMTLPCVPYISHIYTTTAAHFFTTVDYLALWGKNAGQHARPRARAYIKQWSPRRVVVDATGLGVGLASALVAAFLDVVKPVTLSASDQDRPAEPVPGAD